MPELKRIMLSISAGFTVSIAGSAHASQVRVLKDRALPPPSAESKAEFAKVIDETVADFQPIAGMHGARVEYEIGWDSSSYGAFTLRKNQGRIWHITVYDGMLRMPFVTPDLVRYLICHELGHHLGGYPFKDSQWSAAEGQADYFSTHACLPYLWRNREEENREFASKVRPEFRAKCDGVFADPSKRHICYRGAVNLDSLVLYQGYDLQKPPRLSTPDQTKVSTTLFEHPKAQCRVDTLAAGVMCGVPFDLGHIPGYFGVGENTPAAEEDSNLYLCKTLASPTLGARSRCWFAPLELASGR